MYLYCVEKQNLCQLRRQVTHHKVINNTSVIDIFVNQSVSCLHLSVTIYLQIYVQIMYRIPHFKTIICNIYYFLSIPSYKSSIIFFLPRSLPSPIMHVPSVVQVQCQVAHNIYQDQYVKMRFSCKRSQMGPAEGTL